jgi:hypothetical protein
MLSRSDMRKRKKRDSAFMTRILSQPMIWLIGSEDALTC